MSRSLLIQGATLFTGSGGIIENSALLIEDETIRQVGTLSEVNAPENAEIFPAQGKWIVPGLINAHVHIIMEPTDPESNIRVESVQRRTARAVANLQKYLRSGVTFLRDAGGPDYVNIEVEKCLREGIIEGPGMLTAVRALSISGGHGKQWARICDGCDEVRKAAREIVGAGADVLKLIASNTDADEFTFTQQEMETAVFEAKRARKRTMAHATSLSGIRAAVLAGVDSIEHATHLDDFVIKEMLQRGTSIVPTLSAYYFSLQYLRQSGAPQQVLRDREAGWERAQTSFQKAYHAGVKIAFGTDSGTRNNLHDRSAYELVLMTELGMTPAEAIRSATETAAEVLGIENRYGTLAEGKYADFLVLEHSPLENISELLRPQQVYQHGKKIKLKEE